MQAWVDAAALASCAGNSSELALAAVHWTRTAALPGLLVGLGVVVGIFLLAWAMIRWLGE